jgi:N-acetylmuramoyl-L-alanine amidase
MNYVIFSFLFACTALILVKSALVGKTVMPDALPVSTDEKGAVQIVIDPGHGGEDGGASVGDILEKHLNLDVSLTLSDLYTIFGYNTKLTRSDDRMLYDHYGDLSDYTGKRKTYDLRNRLRIAEESGACLFIGIHMNKFPLEKYSGLQTYYSVNSTGSKNAATLIQSYAKKHLSPENKREIKASTDAIYILKRIKMPAVLVECGFLSNNAERALLLTREYREKLATVIFASTAEYISSGK